MTSPGSHSSLDRGVDIHSPNSEIDFAVEDDECAAMSPSRQNHQRTASHQAGTEESLDFMSHTSSGMASPAHHIAAAPSDVHVSVVTSFRRSDALLALSPPPHLRPKTRASSSSAPREEGGATDPLPQLMSRPIPLSERINDAGDHPSQKPDGTAFVRSAVQSSMQPLREPLIRSDRDTQQPYAVVPSVQTPDTSQSIHLTQESVCFEVEESSTAASAPPEPCEPVREPSGEPEDEHENPTSERRRNSSAGSVSAHEEQRVVPFVTDGAASRSSSATFHLVTSNTLDQSTAPTDETSALETSTTSRRATRVKQAEHKQTWQSTLVQNNNNEEAEFAKQFPLWNRPKGAAAVKTPNDTSTTISEPTTPVVERRTKAQEYAEKVRQQHKALLATVSSSPDSSPPQQRQSHSSLVHTRALQSNDSIQFHVEDSYALQTSVGDGQALGAEQRASDTPLQSNRKDVKEQQQSIVHQWLHLQHSGGASAENNPPVVEAADDVQVSPRSNASGDQARRHNPVNHAQQSSAIPALPLQTTMHADSQPQTSGCVRKAFSGTPRRTSSPAAGLRLDIRAAENKRRQLYLLYGQKKGGDLFKKYLNDLGATDTEVEMVCGGGENQRSAPQTARLPQRSGSRTHSPSIAAKVADVQKPMSVSKEPPPLQNVSEKADNNNSVVWDRLFRTQIHHPERHSPARVPLEQGSSERRDRRKTDGGSPANRSREASPSDPAIFQKLYRLGLDEKARREKLHAEGQLKRVEKELMESLDTVIMARILRRSAGHKAMPRAELERLISAERAAYLEQIRGAKAAASEAAAAELHVTASTASDSVARASELRSGSIAPQPKPVPLSAEPILSREEIEDLSTRLYKQGKRKQDEEEKARARRELAECTFRPAINSRDSTPHRPPSVARAASRQAAPRRSASSRSASVDRCRALYEFAKREQDGHRELNERVAREMRLKILKGKLESDHHFRRRVHLDPTLAETFMASLRV